MQNFKIPEEKKPTLEEFKTYIKQNGEKNRKTMNSRSDGDFGGPVALSLLVYVEFQ